MRMRCKSLYYLCLALALSISPGLLIAKSSPPQPLPTNAVSLVGNGKTPVIITRRGNPSVNSGPSIIGFQLSNHSTNPNGTQQQTNTPDAADFFGLTAESQYIVTSSNDKQTQDNKHNNNDNKNSNVSPSNANESGSSSKIPFSNGTIAFDLDKK